MTKADLVEIVSVKLGYTKNDAFDLVDLTLEILKQSIVSEGKVKIGGFGNFEVKAKSERKGRNPQTGEPLVITSRKILTFKPSQILKGQINRE